MKKGRVYFFTGLSGAGKTTLGGMVYERIKNLKDNVVIIDGDVARKVYVEDIGYTDEERLRGAYRTFRVAKWLSDQGIDVVVCSICMYEEVRKWNRDNIETYNEIYIKVSKETLIIRNKKRLYTDGKNVVGVDLPFDEPQYSDLVIENNGDKTPEELVQIICDKFDIN